MNKAKAYATQKHEIPRAKISDGKSVLVTVPEKTTIKPAEFVKLDGWFGFTFTGAKTLTGETEKIAINIEQAEYETTQIAAGNYEVGAPVYFDEAAKKITADAGTDNVQVGRVVTPKTPDGAITFILAAQA